ncbi:MAG: hypothetical protein KatS3mg008_1381 [Acidimicrobiales bacterium]|nr:MAG: hypothetical protein KatS3mg008_1381 [Acidimicrobiales bacterium]
MTDEKDSTEKAGTRQGSRAHDAEPGVGSDAARDTRPGFDLVGQTTDTRRLTVVVLAIVGVLLAAGVGLILAVSGGDEGSQARTEEEAPRISLRPLETTSTRPPRSTTSSSSSTSVTTVPSSTTSVASPSTSAPSAGGGTPAPNGPATQAPTTTLPPTPPILEVFYAQTSDGRLAVRPGSMSSISIRNSGGSSGGYAVRIVEGPITVNDSSFVTGTILPGDLAVVRVKVRTDYTGKLPTTARIRVELENSDTVDIDVRVDKP